MHPDKARTIRPILALAGGIATAMLLWRASIGLSWLIFVAAFVVVSLRFLGATRPTGLAMMWGATAVWLAACVCWRASEWTLAIAFPASLAMAAALPILVWRRLALRELGELPAVFVAWICGGPAAIQDARRWVPRFDARGSRRVLVGLMIGGPIALFTALLLSANPRFVTLVWDLFASTSSVVGFTVWCVCASVAYVIGTLALGRIHCGVLETLRNPPLLGRTTIASAVQPSGESPYRTSGPREVVERVPRMLSPLTWAVVLGQLSLVFGLFVVANLGDLFGGHDLVRDTGTATYAEHLHAGFASVTGATVLSVAVVMLGHRVTAAPAGHASGKLLCALETFLLVLTAITLASCWQRTTIYMDAYGYTHQRVGVMLIQIAVLGLLVLTQVRALVRSWRGFGVGLVILPVVLAVAASTFDADVFVARANLRRLIDAPDTATSSGLDVRYLERLSADALPVLDDAFVPAELAERLGEVWRERAAIQSCGDWRGRRGLGLVLVRSGLRPSP